MSPLEQVLNKETTFTERLAEWLNKILTSAGIGETYLTITKLVVLLAFTAVIVGILLFLARIFFKLIIRKIGKATQLSILNYMVLNKVPLYLGLLAPYTFVRTTIPIIFSDYSGLIKSLTKLTDAYLVLLVIWTIVAVAKSFFNALQERPAFETRPMHSYIQVVTIILYGLGAVTVFAIFTEKSFGVLLAGVGAGIAMIMFAFQDTIKGFIGSIQMTTNNMVELGDWITMSKYGADGTVEEVSLTSVKVRNFDKTITTVPTYALISDSFQNWKGMVESGGRRTKKCIHLKQGSIRFMNEEELAKFRKIDYLNKVILEKEAQYNSLDKALIGNRVPVTNSDLYMAYAMNYLLNHKGIAQDLTLLVRQLAPTEMGIPVEIYMFTSTTKWAEYEGIASDVINHLVAMVPVFELKIFELLSDNSEVN